MNAYRSAIGSVHEKIDGIEVGKQPLIARILKGVYNKRPPRPKYNSVWDVNSGASREGSKDSMEPPFSFNCNRKFIEVQNQLPGSAGCGNQSKY